MPTLTEQLQSAVSLHERELARAPRPDLSRRTKRRRALRRVGQGAAGVGSLAAVTVVGLSLAGVNLGALAPWADNQAGLQPAGEAVVASGFQESLVLSPARGVAVADPADAVVVDVYLDPMCPFCGIFASVVEPELRRTEGVTLVLHPVAFLDNFSDDGSYSTRAGNAIQEVATGAPDELDAFLALLWSEQPREGEGLTDAQLQDLARRANVSEYVVDTFPEHRFADQIAEASQAANAAGITYVPYVVVDGTVVEPREGDQPKDPRDGSWTGLFAAIDAAKAAD